jgi:hypothetical protein
MPELQLPPVRIQMHGRFAVVVDGRSVEHLLPGRRARLLVAVLATSDRWAVDRSTLIELLWSPSHPGDGASATFSALLSKVRALLTPAEIRGRRSLDLVLPPGRSLTPPWRGPRCTRARRHWLAVSGRGRGRRP